MHKKKFEEWLRRPDRHFEPLVPLLPGDRLLALDFTEANRGLDPALLGDTEQFSRYVDRQLSGAGCRYGIGGYAEHRTIYSRSGVFDAEGDGEPRRLHLGIDIWGPVGTPVYAPLAASVHSTGFREAYGDYGAVLILRHETEGFVFHTLYGHLDLESIRHKKEGDVCAAGSLIARFGPPAENGHWPPHLHFQVILDMDGFQGDYPGVCAWSERERYLQNSPDPKPLLGFDPQPLLRS